MSAWNIDTDAHSLIAIGPHIPLMRESNRQDLRKSACGLLRIGDTMRNMPGCHVMTGRFTVALLDHQKTSASKAWRNSPLDRPPRKSDSSIRMSQARKVRTTRSCAGAALAVTRHVLMGDSPEGKARWSCCKACKKGLKGRRPAADSPNHVHS